MMESNSDRKYNTGRRDSDFYASVMGSRAVRALGLLVLATVIFLSTTPDAKAQCDPAADQVAFFVNSNFQGRCVVRGVGEYSSSTNIGLPNDSISSIKVGSNVQTLVCEHTFFEGRCELFTGNDPNLGNNPIGHDRISSAKIQPRGTPATCSPDPSQVAFFQHSNFQGACAVLDIGSYPRSLNIGLANDTISSIKVGSNVQTLVCEHTFFEGQCELFTGNDPNLGNNPIGHDRISSAKVQARGGSTSCEPGRSQVAFFHDSDFKGACEVRGIGDYPSSLDIGLQNDTISSVKVGADVQAVLCRDLGFRGDCQLFSQDDPNLGNDRIGHDQVSSARVQARGHQDCVPERNQVSLFMHSGFLAPCVVKDIGEYSNSSVIGLDNDSASSVRIGQNVQAVLCRDTGFQGDCELFTSSDNSLGNNRIGHDTVSSLKVQPRGFSECLPGTNEVAFFMHSDFLSPCTVKGMGEYKNASEIGLKDNSISSIKVGANVQACVCEGENFGNFCERFTGNDPNLGDNEIRHDSISSAKVQQRGAECKAVTPPQQGFSQIAVFNCHSDRQTVHLWTRDLTTGAPFVERGSLPAQWSNGSCPASASPFIISLTNGHSFQFVAVDPNLIGCGGRNDPQSTACQRFIFTQPIIGDTDGLSLNVTVN